MQFIRCKRKNYIDKRKRELPLIIFLFFVVGLSLLQFCGRGGIALTPVLVFDAIFARDHFEHKRTNAFPDVHS